MDIWTEVADRRTALADRVEELDEAALDTPSWCTGWRIRDVLGHLVYLAEATQARVVRDVVGLGLRPDRALDRTARALADRPVAELVGRLRSGADGRFHIIGTPPSVALGEVLVHRADMFRPIGIDDEVDPMTVIPVLGSYRRLGRVAFHARTSGVTLVATDADLRLGSGPEVRGRAIDLLLLLANRHQVLAWLEGPGLGLIDPSAT